MIDFIVGTLFLCIALVVTYGMIVLTHDEQKRWEDRRKK